MCPSSFISHFVENDIGRIVLNRPECKNAITTDMWRSLPDLIDLMSRNGAKAVVISGAGNVFAAGADLSELESLQTFDQASDNWNAISNALVALSESPMPVIASIDGPCIGGGCLLAIACDLRYATSRSIFGVPVAKLGIILDDASVARLVALIGAGFARELLTRGHVISAEQAISCGLIHSHVEDAAELNLHIDRVCAEILENSASSVSACRSSLARVCGLNAFPSMEDPTAIVESYLTDDFRSRVAKALGR